MLPLKIYVGLAKDRVSLREEYSIPNTHLIADTIVNIVKAEIAKFLGEYTTAFTVAVSITVDGYEYPIFISVGEMSPFKLATYKMSGGYPLDREGVDGLVAFRDALSRTFGPTEDVLEESIRGGLIIYPDLPKEFKTEKTTKAFLINIDSYEGYDFNNFRKDFVGDYEYYFEYCVDNELWKPLVEMLKWYDIEYSPSTLNPLMKYMGESIKALHENIPDGVMPVEVLRTFGFSDITPLDDGLEL